MSAGRDSSKGATSPLSDDYARIRWYSEHAALFIGTVKWGLLGAVAGVSVGLGTKLFLYLLLVCTSVEAHLNFGYYRYYDLLPIALPCCVWIIKTFAPTAQGHGTEAVITAIHNRSGKIDLPVAPVKLFATLLPLSFGGSVGKEGPCAQIGAAIASAFADILRLSDADRRRLVICGIGAGFAAVFGTPVSGALFGIEVLALGKIEYPVLYPCLVAGIVAHIICGSTPPFPVINSSEHMLAAPFLVLIALCSGTVFGLAARAMVESMAFVEMLLHRWNKHPYLAAFVGGTVLAVLYSTLGSAYAGLGTKTIDLAMSGAAGVSAIAFAVKIVSTSISLETGGSGGIVTPLFFVGSTLGSTIGSHFGLPPALLASFGFVAVVAAGTNTPIAASIMAIELLPSEVGVYAALCACTAYLIMGHKSVYKSQLLGYSKSSGLDVPLNIAIGELSRNDIKMIPGSLTERAHKRFRRPTFWRKKS